MKINFWLSSRITLLFIFIATAVNSQVFNPVKWDVSVVQEGENATLFINASIEDKWHLYATKLPSNDGPIATEVKFIENSNYKKVGGLEESSYETTYDPIFAMDVSFHSKKASFSQKIKINSAKEFTIDATVYFMVCDDERCLPPEEIEFQFIVKGADKSAASSDNAANEAIGGLAGDTPNQIFDPVKWTYSVEKHDANTYSLIASATIEENWHVYSQHLPSEDGPVATSLTFNETEGVVFEGEVHEGEYHTEFDPNFDMDLNFFDSSAEFRQIIKVDDPKGKVIGGELVFMTCDDKRCLPPEYIELSFSLDDAVEAPMPSFSKSDDTVKAEADKESEGDKTLFGLFFIGFLLGFAALLTPCVFPMIPMTVSFFTKQSKSKAAGVKNAIIYGLFIIIIYTGLGLILSAIFGPDVMNMISTDPYFNIFLFVLLVVFGISFLGAFEIQLPSSWANKADRASDKGGLIGIFFMAATLAIVSFSCTGPIVGSALAGAAKGGVMGPATIMFGFSLALALPFGLFAAFPGWLNSLPKSGGWLNSVKVVLGLLEIGFAFKFLSNADLVWQLGLLKREMFIAIWIAVSASITLYLFNFIRFPHDSSIDKIGVSRFMIGLLFFILTIYMVPGMNGAPLKLISGFPPPIFYSEAAQTFGGDEAKSGHIVEAQYTDYYEALEVARKEKKPLLVDFTGWACVNCRKMEESVWTQPEISKILSNDVILVSLYVDERKLLPKDEQTVKSYGGKDFKIKTVGNKWTYMEVERYGTNAQPFYVMLDQNEEQLSGSAAYDSDPQVFLDFLEEGLKNYKK
jgi:thiol:disulfide interchange protein DsbD